MISKLGAYRKFVLIFLGKGLLLGFSDTLALGKKYLESSGVGGMGGQGLM